jgi:spore germination protein YaaH
LITIVPTKSHRFTKVTIATLVAILIMTTTNSVPPSTFEVAADSNNSKEINLQLTGIIAAPQIRAMWLGSNFLLHPTVQTVEQAKNFLNSIGNPDYVYVRPAYTVDGNPDFFEIMTINFASLVHSASNKTKVLATIEIVTDNPANYIYCDLSNQTNREIVVTSMAQIINKYGFDGTVIDIEPLMSGTTWLPQMIQQLKTLTGKPVIIYGFRIVDQGILLTEGYGWTASDMQAIASIADYVEISLYNFGCTTANAYKNAVLDQISRVTAAGLISKILFILPTFGTTDPNLHDDTIETLYNAGPLVQSLNTGLYDYQDITNADLSLYVSWFGR